MNILIVTAHPSSKGDTHTIANTYAEVKKANNHTVQIVNLYAKEWRTDLLEFENIREYPLSSVQKKFHEQILWANEIVVVHPVWWGTPPSIMKSWAELTFWPRIAYQYTPKGVDKLLKGKTAKIFVTCGGPSWYYYLPFMPLKSFWATSLFNFCGLDVTDLKVCGYTDVYKDEKRTKHIAKFLESIKKSALTKK